MNTGTLGTRIDEPLTLDKIKLAMAELAAIPENKNWLVVTPNGQMYIGEFKEVMPVFMKHHPLIGKPLVF